MTDPKSVVKAVAYQKIAQRILAVLNVLIPLLLLIISWQIAVATFVGMAIVGLALGVYRLRYFMRHRKEIEAYAAEKLTQGFGIATSFLGSFADEDSESDAGEKHFPHGSIPGSTQPR